MQFFYINKKDILKEGNGYVSVSFDYNSIESCFNEKNESTKPFIKRRTLDPNLPTIALTFDDGPHRVNTNRLLDILSENNAKATFFVLGSRAIYEPDILMRMVNEGHQIGNHTYSHKSLSTLTINEIDQEVSKTNDFVKSVTGKDVELIRPPYGAVNQTVISNTDEPLILWSIDTLDWKSKNKDKIREEVLTKVKDGDIILMHDIYKSTIDACETIIPELIEQGYQLVTVDELFELKGIDLNANNKYYSAKTK